MVHDGLRLRLARWRLAFPAFPGPNANRNRRVETYHWRRNTGASAHFESFLALNSLRHVFGLADAVPFLDVLRAMGQQDSALVGTIRDPCRTDDAVHLAYHETNRAAGRMAGEVRWHSIIRASRAELAEMADRVGWRLVETTPPVDAPGVNFGAVYGAVLRPLSR
jgi:hypothetical protein